MEATVFGRLRRMEPSLLVLLLVILGAIAAIGLAMALSAPVDVLVGVDQWKIVSAFHGMSATVFLLSATIAVYLSWRLYTGQIKAFEDLKWLSLLATAMSALTIAFGTWVYIAYRAPGGPRQFFLETGGLAEIHEIFFEFKEFIALFTLPMFLTATYILWRYGKPIVGHREARAVPSILILLGFAFLLIAYVLGAAITKLRGV